MKLDTALEYLPLVIKKDIRHIDYKRVCELASDYFAYYTGKGLDEKLQQVTSTETKEEFDQRKLLTKHITKSVLNSTKIPFNKALRKKPEHNKIDFITKGKEGAIKEINEYIETFNGTRSLDEFLEVLFIEFNYHDPNAWLIVEFEPNDVLRKAQPYPFIATADQVIDYKLNNGILDYVVVMLDIKYTEEGKQKDGKKYTLYAGNETIVIQNIGSDYILQEGQESIEINDKRYSKEVFTVKAETDPDLTPAAIRFGYIQDPATQYRTFISVYDCAMPYLEKTLKINSEFDQSNAMITFAQRFMYQNRCNAEGCHRGTMPDGSQCQSCKGTGLMQAHSGVQQIISLPLPDNKEEMIDLNGMMVYKTPPIELLTFQKDYINQLKIDIHTTIFNVDLISKTEVSTTATEQLLNRDNMNDTLLPFARHYSEVRTLCVYFIAVYTDNVKTVNENGKTQPDIIISHKFPYDFKLKTLGELMGDLKAAYDSKASIATISAIEDDINEILYYDRPDELKKIRTINKYNPFRGNTPDEVKLMIASNLVSKFDQVLYTNLFNIFAELERENQEPWFYDLDEKKIYDLVVKKVEERAGKLTNEQPKPIERVDYNSPVPQTNEEYIVYDDQIQINFKTNNKFISSDDDLLITPVVLMTEGVHIGSHGAILHKISELGKIPASWNGIPIVINHPKKEDKYVSANNPQILKESEVGRIYNTRVENDKLVSEAWINKAKLKSIHSNLLNDLQEGNEIEVSIGAFPEYKISKGNWNSEKYDAIAVNYRPDHLAILPDSKGACSNEDGAGINVNGGEGSGNFGHEGRPGLVGGSGDGNKKNENFKKWFGNSKVIDENGDPLVVYHGTNREINEFKLEEADIESSYGKAFYFTDEPKEASKYAISHKDHKERGSENASVVPVYLKMENPVYVGKTKIDTDKLFELYPKLEYDDRRIVQDVDRFVKTFNKKQLSVDELELAVRFGKTSGGRVTRIFKILGYDGVIYNPKKDLNIKEKGNHYVVFSPTQIKSAVGNATFNPDDTIITNQLAINI